MNPEESYPSERELELEAEYYEDKSLREREDRVENFIDSPLQKPWIEDEEIF